MIRYGLLLVIVTILLGSCVQTTIARANLSPKGDAARPPVLSAEQQAKGPRSSEPFVDITKALQENVYGYFPDRSSARVIKKTVLDPLAFSGKARLEEWQIEVEAGFGDDASLAKSNRGQFNLVVILPNAVKAPVPVIMMQTFCPSDIVIPLPKVSKFDERGGCEGGGGGLISMAVEYVFGRYIASPPIEEILDHGYAIATHFPSEVFPDSSSAGPKSLLGMSSGHEDDTTRWGSVAAWAWLQGRVVDVLEDDARFDRKASIAYGHSRYGKSALLAAAFDRRIDGVIGHQSGTGGASLSRGNRGETIAKITKTYPYWFSKRFAEFSGRADEMPVDQHQLLALLAPRPVLLGNARRDVWSDPNGAFRSAQAASSAWNFFGYTGLEQERLVPFNPEANLAFWIRPGTHGVTEEDWPAFLSFLDAHFGSEAKNKFNPVEASIAEVKGALQTGQISCRRLVSQYLWRIAKYDQSSGLNAIVYINPNALQRAQALDEEQAAGGVLRSLHCLPVLVKDNFDTYDMPTTGGSIALKTSIPPDDSFMVAKLREAGAVIIAKTNMAEWAFSPRETISSSYGRTANAYDLSRVPAGSSGGTASAVAASFAVAGLGSDTGNSIRGPSSHLALVGMRSTFGLTSRDGVIPLAGDRDIAGPMARSVTDVAKLFNVLAGYDPKDLATEAGKGKREADYTAFLDAKSLRGARIGVLRQWVDHEDADPQITALFFKAIADMEAQGAIIVDPVAIPNIEQYLQNSTFCPTFRYDMRQYLKTLGNAAPITDVNEVLHSGQYGPDAKGGLEFFSAFPADTPPEQWDEPCQRFVSNEKRQAYRADVIAAMDEAKLDAMIYPTWSNPPAHIDRGRAEYKGDNSQNLAPNTGLPAMTVPMGFSHEKWPAGITLIARPFDEKTLFALGYAYEQASMHRKPPPIFAN